MKSTKEGALKRFADLYRKGGTANGFLFWGDETCSKSDCVDSFTTLKILGTVELHTLNEQIVHYVNDIKVIFKKLKTETGRIS